MGCLYCGRGMHPFCNNNGCEICHPTVPETLVGVENEDEDWRVGSKRGTRSQGKRDESLRDQQSTGRKRAAVKYPLHRDNTCEWQGLRFAGGGDFPIVGCLDGLQQARHHGPDKNTLNNDEGNVHRICHSCHNRWHSRNDTEYRWGGIYRPHDTVTKATDEEIWTEEQSWFGKKLKKVVD